MSGYVENVCLPNAQRHRAVIMTPLLHEAEQLDDTAAISRPSHPCAAACAHLCKVLVSENSMQKQHQSINTHRNLAHSVTG